MSNFTWKDLIQLGSPSKAYESPLSCIAHIDMNAFFAQVEQMRCGLSKEDPVVCVQWNSIIAVSYAARKYGISRMDTIQEALKKCDNLIPIHTAVFKKGEDFWQYHDGWGSWVQDPAKQINVENHKVSLEPYRRESRKALKIFKSACDLVERASIDEVFLDLGRICFNMLMFDDEYELTGNLKLKDALSTIREVFIGGNYDINSHLPPIPEKIKSLKFEGDVFNPEGRNLITDWDDVILALGSQASKSVRDTIKDILGYTTSCGLSSTKNVCKLASNYKKPDAQTVVKNNCLLDFLDCGKFEITSFWTLGGVLGKELIDILNLPDKNSIKHIRETWPDNAGQLKKFLDARVNESDYDRSTSNIDPLKTAELAEKLFKLSRGQYSLPLSSRPVVKSMMSNKNLRGKSCNSILDCISWLEVFCAELASRIQDLEQEYNKIVIPRTVSISLKTKSYEVYRKSGPITYKGINFQSHELLKVGVKFVTELDAKGKNKSYYPLTKLSMTITNFDILDLQKTVVDMFGNQVHTFKSSADKEDERKTTSSRDDEEIPKLECSKCQVTFTDQKAFQEHGDYHLALKLSEGLNGVEETSKNLSFGEKRLLFSQKRSSSQHSTAPRKKQATSSKNILSFFTREK
ncbi:DNA-directed DNA polymerase eta [Saccharomyces paradoxus]|uniref:DNA polymerase eta n=1 Tax=Saccharomyces paradoxus TaxID=27291 RepID=A0A8B8UPF5_SACPA|nr:Rad30 [Saccharomyces paradoxus]QHS72606.1 Rad30 [Saccharomyces paradoxus]